MYNIKSFKRNVSTSFIGYFIWSLQLIFIVKILVNYQSRNWLMLATL
jgi:hypothetical protein